MAWSEVIYSSYFQDAVKTHKRNKRRFGVIFIIAPVIILTIVGTVVGDVASYALGGLALSVVFCLSFLFSELHTRRQRSWEGVVVERYQKEEEREKDRDDKNRTPIYDTFDYVVFQEDNGKKHKVKEKDGRRAYVYHYFNVGDRARFHGGMELHFPYEKFDKSADTTVMCSFCAHPASKDQDLCPKCHNPLLK